jgi:hypothetical protein
MTALFKNVDEEKQAIVVGAAVVLHALIAGKVAPRLPEPFDVMYRQGAVSAESEQAMREAWVREAFAIAEEFWRQTKSRLGP